MKQKPNVLIVGAGPAGLVSAMVLASAGIPVTVLERNTVLAQDLRASTFHPPTLDLLARFDLPPQLIAQGLVARYTQQRDRREGVVAEFDLQLLEGETQHPFRLQCEQWKLTRLLADRLSAMPHVQLVFDAAVDAVSQDADGVHVSATVEGVEARYTGTYLIGADGAWSTVRRQLDIDFEGYTYPERFVVISTDFEYADHFPDLSYVNYISDPQEWCVLLRVPTLWRVLFPTAPDESDEMVMSESSIQSRLQQLVPRSSDYSTVHRTLYKVHQRVATHFRRGRVFLAGDAAHINNPLGGMGMNGGVHDAFSLADKLVAVMNEGAAPALLDRYERQRRAIAIEYINANTARNKKNIEERDPVLRRKNHDELRAIAADPAAARDYVRKISMIDAMGRAQAIA
jgi:2-polyprenyl-6-methoxyphenol hydroxylase and related FAD-dependent oxidoreductases